MLKFTVFNRLITKDWCFVLCLYLFATVFNINKAIHNDDPFHLEAAQWIETHPTMPMSGIIDWNVKDHIYYFNQPPLLFYMLSVVGRYCDYNEIGLHLFHSLFTLLIIIFLFRIARKVVPDQAKFATALFVLNPGFVVNQLLSVDTPILALFTIIVYYLLDSRNISKMKSIGIGLLLSGALLIKYTSLAFWPILVIMAVKNRKLWLSVTMPLISLMLWSIWNVHEFGDIHIINRSANGVVSLKTIRMAIGYVVTLGSLAFFSVIIIDKRDRLKRLYRGLLFVIGVFFLLGLFFYSIGVISDLVIKWILRIVFAINGMVVIVPFLMKILNKRYLLEIWDDQKLQVLWLWMLGFVAFIVLFAPFMATRHVMLALPPIIILLVHFVGNISMPIKYFSVILTVCFTMLLGVSDWLYGDYFRQEVKDLASQFSDKKIYFDGQIGWQWYARQNGFIKYDSLDYQIGKDDILVVASNSHADKVNKEKFQLKEVIKATYSPLRMFSTGVYNSFYISGVRDLPWNLRRTSIDSICVYTPIENNY